MTRGAASGSCSSSRRIRRCCWKRRGYRDLLRFDLALRLSLTLPGARGKARRRPYRRYTSCE